MPDVENHNSHIHTDLEDLVPNTTVALWFLKIFHKSRFTLPPPFLPFFPFSSLSTLGILSRAATLLFKSFKNQMFTLFLYANDNWAKKRAKAVLEYSSIIKGSYFETKHCPVHLNTQRQKRGLKCSSITINIFMKFLAFFHTHTLHPPHPLS